MIKKTLTVLALALTISLPLLLNACGGSDDPSPADKARSLLKDGTWVVNSVKVDGIDRTPIFSGLTLKFMDQTYTASNGGFIWGTSANWSFVDNKATELKIGADLTVTIVELTKTSMKLSLPWDETVIEGGRKKSIEGMHEFQFIK
jgi:hypothetical protein